MALLNNFIQLLDALFGFLFSLNHHAEPSEFAGNFRLVTIKIEASAEVIFCAFLVVFAQIIIPYLLINGGGVGCESQCLLIALQRMLIHLLFLKCKSEVQRRRR